jgi:hypothetical protein
MALENVLLVVAVAAAGRILGRALADRWEAALARADLRRRRTRLY